MYERGTVRAMRYYGTISTLREEGGGGSKKERGEGQWKYKHLYTRFYLVLWVDNPPSLPIPCTVVLYSSVQLRADVGSPTKMPAAGSRFPNPPLRKSSRAYIRVRTIGLEVSQGECRVMELKKL